MSTLPDVDRSLADGYRLLREEAARLDLPEIAVFEITGEDRKGWLQGQLTADLRDLGPGGSRLFCMCSPTGQLSADGALWALESRYYMAVPRASRDAVLERFERLVILEDIQAREVTDLRLVSIQGPRATQELQQILELPLLDAGECQWEGASVVCLRSDRTGLGGWDLLVPNNFEPKLEGIPLASAAAYDVARLEAGIPAFGRDSNPKTLPPELGRAYAEARVSLSKGCYSGHEVLMRIDSRGHTNRTWMGLAAEAPLEAGATLTLGGVGVVGTVTSCGLSPTYGPIGAGFIRNEAAHPGTELSASTSAGEVSVEVRRMPLLSLD